MWRATSGAKYAWISMYACSLLFYFFLWFILHYLNLQTPPLECCGQREQALVPLHSPLYLWSIPMTIKHALPVAVLDTPLIMPGRGHRTHMIKAETATIDAGEIFAAE